MSEITVDPHKLRIIVESILFVILSIPCIFALFFSKEFVMATKKLFNRNLNINEPSLFVLKYGILLPISLLIVYIISLILYFMSRI